MPCVSPTEARRANAPTISVGGGKKGELTIAAPACHRTRKTASQTMFSVTARPTELRKTDIPLPSLGRRAADVHPAHAPGGELAHQAHQRLFERILRAHRPGGDHVVDLAAGEHEAQDTLVVARVRILLAQFRDSRRRRGRLEGDARRAVCYEPGEHVWFDRRN